MKYFTSPVFFAVLLLSLYYPTRTGLTQVQLVSKESADGFPVKLGDGFDSVKGEFKGQVAVKGETLDATTPAATVRYWAEEVSSHRDARQALGVEMHASARGFLGRVSAKAEFAKKVQVNENTRAMVFRVWVEFPGVTLSNARFTETKANDRKNNAARYHSSYGDCYVEGIKNGGELYAIAHLTATTREAQQRLGAAMDVVITSFKAGGKVDQAQAEVLNSYRLTIQIEEKGGILKPLPRFEELDSYVREFTDRIRQSRGVQIEYRVRSYDEIPVETQDKINELLTQIIMKSLDSISKHLDELDLLETLITRIGNALNLYYDISERDKGRRYLGQKLREVKECQEKTKTECVSLANNFEYELNLPPLPQVAVPRLLKSATGDQGYRYSQGCKSPDGEVGYNAEFLGECGDLTNESARSKLTQENLNRVLPRSLLGARMVGVILPPGLRLKEFNLCHADLSDAVFAGVLLSLSDLSGASLSGARFDGALLDQCTLHAPGKAVVVKASFKDVDFQGADFNGMQFRECNFMDANFSDAKFSGGTFTRCLFAGARFERVRAYKLHFPVCELSGANFTDASLRSCTFIGANLGKTILTRADLRTEGPDITDLTGAIWGDVRVDGTGPRYAEGARIGPTWRGLSKEESVERGFIVE